MVKILQFLLDYHELNSKIKSKLFPIFTVFIQPYPLYKNQIQIHISHLYNIITAQPPSIHISMSDESQQLQQLQQQENQQQERPKRVRRTRKDCDQRTFICKICEKSYLSNAALYTHVKNKHQGEMKDRKEEKDKDKSREKDKDKEKKVEKMEKGKEKVQEKKKSNSTPATGKQEGSSPHLPKMSFLQKQLLTKKQQKQKSDPFQQEPYPNPNTLSQEPLLNPLQKQLQPSSSNPHPYSQKQQKLEYVNTNNDSLENLRQFMKKYYPERNKGCTIRLICQGLAPEILEYIQPILRQSIQLRIPQTSRPKLPINKIFGIFLLLMNQRVSSACINFLLRFFYHLHNALLTQTHKPHYCSFQNASQLPTFFNSIILNQRIPGPGSEEEEMMYNPGIACKVLLCFGEWMYGEGYTDWQIVANWKEDG